MYVNGLIIILIHYRFAKILLENQYYTLVCIFKLLRVESSKLKLGLIYKFPLNSPSQGLVEKGILHGFRCNLLYIDQEPN